ncbi:LysR substrate-binding domain protein [Bordetella hinzii CA90 BAL1384]|nr:LysR substrate-binding domain protein [Bordetella hinzii CA90 BAL1384]
MDFDYPIINTIYISRTPMQPVSKLLTESSLARSLDWNLLRTFLVIAEAQGISAAADILGRTQPAVSAALKRLEETMGTQLVQRSSTRFSLSETGALLHRECREIFHTIRNIPGLIGEDPSAIAGTLQLHMASHIVSDIIDDTLATFHQRYPQVALDICLQPSSALIESLLNRSINFGVSLACSKVAELEYFHLYQEYFGLFCGPRHPLFGKRGLKLEDLAGHNAVSFKVVAASEVLQTINGMYRQAKLAMPFRGISDHLEEVRRMVLAGLGVGALPLHVAARDVRDGLLWRLPPFEHPTPIDVYLVSNPKAQLSRAEQAFVRVMQEVTAAKPIEARIYAVELSEPR